MPDHYKAIEEFGRLFGKKMYTDHLTMTGQMRRQIAIDIPLDLSFDHEMMDGVEIEYISSTSAEHWHQEIIKTNGNQPFLSHLGVYCEKDEMNSIMLIMAGLFVPILQRTLSSNHTNKRAGDDLFSSRSYLDVIFDTRALVGFNVKLSCKAPAP